MTERQAGGAPIAPLSRFTYRGPTSGMTLKRDGAPPIEVMLYDGKDVEVPADHPHVVTLVAQRFLTPVEVPAAAATDAASDAASKPAARLRAMSSSAPSSSTTETQ